MVNLHSARVVLTMVVILGMWFIAAFFLFEALLKPLQLTGVEAFIKPLQTTGLLADIFGAIILTSWVFKIRGKRIELIIDQGEFSEEFSNAFFTKEIAEEKSTLYGMYFIGGGFICQFIVVFL